MGELLAKGGLLRLSVDGRGFGVGEHVWLVEGHNGECTVAMSMAGLFSIWDYVGCEDHGFTWNLAGTHASHRIKHWEAEEKARKQAIEKWGQARRHECEDVVEIHRKVFNDSMDFFQSKAGAELFGMD